MERHLAHGVKVYDPMVTKEIVPNQYHDLEAFLKEVDLVVLMIGHDEIKEHLDKLEGKIVLDTRRICNLPGVYHL